MGIISGERSAEIGAPIERCYEIAADIERGPEWQGSLEEVKVLERGPDGRAVLVETESDAKVKSLRAPLRFAYDPPGAIRWVQEQGDVKSLAGAWTLVDLGRGRTRATYSLTADPGRLLGCCCAGPCKRRCRTSSSSPPSRASSGAPKQVSCVTNVTRRANWLGAARERAEELLTRA